MSSPGHLIASIGNAKAVAVAAYKHGNAPAPRFVLVSPDTARMLGCTHVHGLEIRTDERLTGTEFALLATPPSGDIELNRTKPANMAIDSALRRRPGARLATEV